MSMQECPTEERLQQHLFGSVANAEAEELDAHLSTKCPTCVAALERLTKTPFELLLLREAQPPPPDVPGYTVTSLLGMGGMGAVYLAEQHSPQRSVALKTIRAGLLATHRQRVRFQLEADALAKLQHPHIVQVFEVGAVEGQPWFAMEYVDGGSLNHSGNVPSTPGAAAALVICLAEAVQHAHDRGVIHRDLKPGNVLFTRDGLAKICDFGLARLASSTDELTQDAPVGTPSYMAPEQTGGSGSAVTVRTDIYALGAILYHLLTGRPPFQGESREEVLQQVRTAEPVPPRKLQPAIPLDLEIICLKCLDKDPARRYADAAQLADRLRLFLENKPIPDRPVSTRERLWRWCRRNPVVAGAGSAAMLAGLIALTTFVVAFFMVSASRDEAVKLAEDNGDLATKNGELATKALNAKREADERRERAECLAA